MDSTRRIFARRQASTFSPSKPRQINYITVARRAHTNFITDPQPTEARSTTIKAGIDHFALIQADLYGQDRQQLSKTGIVERDYGASRATSRSVDLRCNEYSDEKGYGKMFNIHGSKIG
jgi:hypothetical protein